MKLIAQKYNYHVSLDTVNEFEQIILADSSITSKNETNRIFSKLLFFAFRMFIKNKVITGNKDNSLAKKNPNDDLLAVLMGPDFSKCLPHFMFSKNKSLYIFDAWPKEHAGIIEFLNFFKVNNVFLTSSQAVEILQPQVEGTACFWLPEGINPENYMFNNYNDKSIDVLAFGRRYDEYHEQIVECLENNNKQYLYEKERGNIIFPTREDFIMGMAKSKISICVPSNITHPERSGNFETMTIRYLQSMASKCIILGHAPVEMITLFGYNPVIEIDLKNAEDQLLSILNNYSEYIPFVEKNYQTMLQHHTWQCRWDTMKQLLGKN